MEHQSPLYPQGIPFTSQNYLRQKAARPGPSCLGATPLPRLWSASREVTPDWITPCTLLSTSRNSIVACFWGHSSFCQSQLMMTASFHLSKGQEIQPFPLLNPHRVCRTAAKTRPLCLSLKQSPLGLRDLAVSLLCRTRFSWWA